MNRRSFLRFSAATLAALPFAHLLFAPAPAAANPTLPLLQDSAPMAKSLQYCTNADKPTPQCKARKEPKRKNEYCNNCQLYAAVTTGKDEQGKCLLFPKNLVGGKSWCMSWVKKPGT